MSFVDREEGVNVIEKHVELASGIVHVERPQREKSQCKRT